MAAIIGFLLQCTLAHFVFRDLFQSQIDELKQYQLPSNNQLRSMLLDPTVNVVIMRLKKELENTRQRLEESQTELSAWKFTQDRWLQEMAMCPAHPSADALKTSDIPPTALSPLTQTTPVAPRTII